MAAAAGAGAGFFLDSRTTAQTRAREAARIQGIVSGARDIFLDHDPAPDKIREALRLAVERAKEEPTVIIAHPSAAVVAALQTGLPEAFAQGIAVYPLSEVLTRAHREAFGAPPAHVESVGPSPGERRLGHAASRE